MNNIFKKYLTLTITFLVFCLHLAGQNKRTNNWYFGYNAGIDFNKTPPESLTNGALNTREGCATISDENGNLLFYTDGDTVYNSKHDIMPNGTGLGGDKTSTQSAIIVPFPGNDSLYNIFTVGGPEGDIDRDKNKGFYYSLVNMNIDGGLGDVIIGKKKIELLSDPTEKLTSVLHQNKKGIWVITHQNGSNKFYSYLVSESGIANPVISGVGAVHGGRWSFAGQMKASPDGTRLAVAIEEFNNTSYGIIEIFEFDNLTGIVSNPIVINGIKERVYGIEFSTDASKLYFGNFPSGNHVFIWQADLSATYIPSSIQEIISYNSNKHFCALQLAPDGKIYVARSNANYLSAIKYPNLLGTACEFQDTAINLGNKKCKLGLPNFIQSSIVEDTTTTTTGKTKPPSEKECESCISSFAPEPGKKYVINAWVKEDNAPLIKTSFNYPKIIIYYQGGFIPKDIVPFTAKGNIIDGWQRIQEEFSIPADATDIFIQLTCSTGDCFFDDIRIHPFDATMKSFVYDPVSLKLTAILDENNYATFYEYDEEGKLIRLKKETERGIMTIKENRNSLIK